MNRNSFKKLMGIILAMALVAVETFVIAPVSATTAAYGSLLQTFDTITGVGGAYPGSTQVGICKSDGTQTYVDASTSEAVNPLSVVTETGRGNVLRFKKTPATAAYTAHVLIRGTETAGITGITAGTYYNAIVSFDYRVETAYCAGNGTLLKQFNLATDGGYYRYNWGQWNSATNSCSKLVSVNNYSSAEEPESTYSALKLIKDGDWHTYSFAVTLGTKDAGSKLGFVFDSPANDDIEFYLDNVGLTVIDVSTGTNGATVCLHSNGGNALDLMGGIVGETMTLPTPVKAGAVFSGWYSDSGLTTPAGNTFIANTESWGSKTNAITNYYAKWSTPYREMVQNFDSATEIGGDWGSQTVISSDATYLSIVPEEGRGNVLKVNKSDASGSYGTGIRIRREDGAESLGEVLAGTTYDLIVTFDYKVEDASGNAWGPYIGRTYIYYTPYNYWSQGVSSTYPVAFDNSASAEEPESHYSAYRAICDGEWHTMSFKTSGKAIEYSANGAFVFTLDINDGDKFVACFDNFSVKKLESGIEASTVCLHSNGADSYDIMTGIVGNEMILPTPMKAGSEFFGWYADSECTISAGNTYVSNTETFGTKANAITNYYAKWKSLYNDIATDFEDYSSLGGSTDVNLGTNKPTYEDTSSATQTGIEILDLADGEHNKVLHFNKKTSSAKYQPTVIIGKGSGEGVSTVKDETYNTLIRFDYKVNSSNSNSFYVNRFHFTNEAKWPSSNGKGGFAGKETYLSAEEPEDYGSYKLICDNTWRTVEVVIWDVPAKATVGEGLARIGFTFDTGTTARCDLYIDNFSATRLSSSVAYSNICIHPNNGKAFDLTTASVGSEVSLPTLTKKDKEFVGWYTNSTLTTPLGDTIIAASDNWNSAGTIKVLNVYAKWQELSNTLIAGFDNLSSVGGTTDAGIGTDKPTYTDKSSETQTGVEILDLADGVHGKVLHLSKVASSSKYQPAIIVGNNSGDGINTVKDETYNTLIRFDYKINSSNSNSFYVNRFHFTDEAKWPSTTGSGGFCGKSTFLSAETPDDYGSYKFICDNKWHSVKIVIFNVPAHATITDKSARLGFTFDTGKTAQCDLYLDNFKATQLPSEKAYSNICIHPDNGEVYDLTADEVGGELELPDINKQGSFFCGWYTDSEFTTPVSDTVTAATDDWNTSGTIKVLNFYAKWVLKFDVNNDGSAANADDLKSLRKALISGEIVDSSTLSVLAADCNRDSTISLFDYVFLKKLLVKLYIDATEKPYTPSALTVTMYDTSTNTYGFTWNTDAECTNSVLQICSGTEFNSASCTEYIPDRTAATTYVNTDVYGDLVDAVQVPCYVYKATVNLTPGQTYSYRVYDKDNGTHTASYQFTARNTEATKFTFAHISDSQVDAADALIKDNNTAVPLNCTLNGIMSSSEDIDFLLHTGDVVEYSKYESFWRTMLDYNADYLATIPTMAISGNHETTYRCGSNETYKHFNYNIPTQDTLRGFFYYFDYGNARFIMLNTNRLTSSRLTDDQYNWLVSVLENNPQKWTIVSLHNPMYSVGAYGADTSKNYISLALRSQLGDLFATYGVDLVLQGHDHTYSKTYPIGVGGVAQTDYTYQTISSIKYAVNPTGVIYAMNGPAGNQTRTPHAIDSTIYELAEASNYCSWAEITVEGDKLTVTVKYYNNGNPQVWNSYGIIKN